MSHLTRTVLIRTFAMAALFAGFISLFGDFFITDSKEIFELFENQKKAGYSWQYTGAQKPPPKTKYFSLKTGDGEDVVLYQLKRVKKVSETANLFE